MKAFKIFLKLVSTVIFTMILLLMFLLVGIRIFGLQPYTVLSGSMESVYPTGSIIYVKSVNPKNLAEGDIITFKMANGIVATHRIVELVPDDNGNTVSFRTKGDENDIADGSLVKYEAVIGQPQFCIAKLGYFATFLKRKNGIAFLIVAVLVATALEITASNLTSQKDVEIIKQTGDGSK